MNEKIWWHYGRNKNGNLAALVPCLIYRGETGPVVIKQGCICITLYKLGLYE